MAAEAHLRSEKYQKKIDPFISALRDKVVAAELMWRKYQAKHHDWLRFDEFAEHLAVTHGIKRLFLSRFKSKLWKAFHTLKHFQGITRDKKFEEIMLEAEEYGFDPNIFGLILKKILEVPYTAPLPPYFDYRIPIVESRLIKVEPPILEKLDVVVESYSLIPTETLKFEVKISVAT